MDNPSLAKFVSRVLQTKRIGFGDLRRLQRDVLPDGIRTPEEAEALIALDGAVEKADRAWLPFLAAAIRAFVVGSSPASGIDPSRTAWLVGLLSGASARTAHVIAREVVRDTGVVDDTLLALAKQRSRTRVQPEASSTEHAPSKPMNERALPVSVTSWSGSPDPWQPTRTWAKVHVSYALLRGPVLIRDP